MELLPIVPGPASGWSRERMTRFLSLLAESGNVRRCARACGLSTQSVYKLRRRDAVFAQGWGAALVLARDHAEQALADRAIEGVEEPIFYRGEQVGVRRRYDTRLLLAHLARLDRQAEDKAAQAAAGRFDELLAVVAGEAVPSTLPLEDDCPWPQERSLAAGQAAAEAEEKVIARRSHGGGPRAERACDRAITKASDAAWHAVGAEWDAWFAQACTTVDSIDDVAPGFRARTLSTVSTGGLAAGGTMNGQAS